MNEEVNQQADQSEQEQETKTEEIKTILYGEEKPQEEKPKEEVPQEQPPIEIKLERKENSLLTESEFKNFEKFVSENKLNQSQAELFLNREEARKSEYFKQSEESLKATTEGWYKEISNDPEYGGAKLKETAEFAKRALKEFGDDRLIKDLDNTGLGNHPSLVKMLSQIGKLMADDKLVRGMHAKPVKSRAEILYGDN